MNPLSTTDDTFAKSHKPRAVEEFLDFYFYRRIAHRMVPHLHRWNLTPNQVTTISLILGLAAGVAVLYQQFVLSGFLAVMTICFDCCDGQLARLTGQSSQYGRAMDGFFDFIWIFTYWWMIYFSGLLQESQYPGIFLLMVASSIGMILHCWRFDGIKLKSLEFSGAKFSEGDMDVPEVKKLLKEEWSRFNIFSVILLLCMYFQMYFFVRGGEKKQKYTRTSEETERLTRHFDPVLNCWSWLGEGHHNTLVILGIFLAPLTPNVLVAVFWFILVPMNLWWFYCEWLWHRAVKRMPTSI